MDQDSVHMVAASKVPMLKPGKYELWRMRMEQYIQMIDYSLWEVIENGNAPPITKVVEGVETTIAPTTAKEKAQRRLELKARSTLLFSIANEYQLKFNFIKDDKSIRRNKPEIDTLSLDDLYNNLKIYEPEVKGTSSSSTNTQNIAFVSSNSTNSTNGVVNIVHGATTASTQATVVNLTTIDNLSDDVIYLRWQIAMLRMRARRFLKNTRRKLTVNGNETIGDMENTRRVVPVETTTSNALVSYDGFGYDWSDQAEEGLESVEARLLVYKKNDFVYEEDIKVLKRKIHLREVAITELRRKLELVQKQKDEIQLTVRKVRNSSKNISKLIDCQIVDKCKKGLGYNVVPPPYTRNFMPLKPDLSFFSLEEFTSEPIVIKPIVDKSEAKASEAKPKAVRKNMCS
ncbi:hypothetical protein Tco_1175589 [Tanacetum coccineum]